MPSNFCPITASLNDYLDWEDRMATIEEAEEAEAERDRPRRYRCACGRFYAAMLPSECRRCFYRGMGVKV